jgi:hypothetical protein
MPKFRRLATAFYLALLALSGLVLASPSTGFGGGI